jgi:hypothetical protein
MLVQGAAMHIAQVNIARLLVDRGDPMVADFFAAIGPINAIADVSPGFVWRLQDEQGDATSIRPWDDDRLIVNMSVWASIEALEAYVYRSAHLRVLRRRREWFERLDQRFVAMWWVPAGHLPSIDEAKARLEHLERHGPTPTAFSFRQRFPPPDLPAVVADAPAVRAARVT